MVLFGAAALLAAVLLLLAVPLTVVFRVGHAGETRGQLNLSWLFGLVRHRMEYPTSPETTRRPRPKKSKRRGKPRFARGREAVSVFRQAAFRRRAVRFAKDVLSALHARGFYLRLRVGLDDPAETGRLWALLGPLAGAAAAVGAAEIRIAPVFTEPVLEVEGGGEFRLMPLQFIALAVSFAASPATLRALYTVRQGGR